MTNTEALAYAELALRNVQVDEESDGDDGLP